MATVVDRPVAQTGLEERFFLRAAIAMAVVVASGIPVSRITEIPQIIDPTTANN